MAIKFSCSLRFSEAFRENYVAVYQPDNSDEYKVKYKSNVCRDLLLNIEWNVPKQVLVTVKLFSKSFKKCFSSKGAVVNGCKTFLKLRGAFNVSGSPDYTILCLISLIPYVKFRNISIQPESVIEKSDPNLKEKSQEVETCNSTGGSTEITNPNKNILDADAAIVSKKDLLNDCVSPDFSTDCDNVTTADSGTLNMETQLHETAALRNDCTEPYTCAKITLPGLLKNKYFSSSDGYNNYDVQNLNFRTSDDSTDYVKIKKCVFLKDDQENEKDNSMEDLSTPKVENHNRIPSDYIPMEDCSVTGIESQESPSDGQSLLLDVLDIPEKNNENISLLISSDNPKADQTIANEMQQMEMEIKENLTNHVDSIIEFSCMEIKENNISDTLAETNKGTESETQYIAENEPDNIASCNVEKEDIEAQTRPFSDISTKNIPLFDFSKSSVEQRAFTTDNSKEIGMNHSSINIHQTLIAHEMFQKQLSPEVNELQNDALVNCYPDSLRTINEIEKVSSVENRTVQEKKNVVKECSSSYSSIFSSKTDLVSETLIQRLSKDNILKSGNEGETLESNNEIENKISTTYGMMEKCFPVMENALNGLSMDMLDLLMSGDMTDSTLTNGVKEVRIHKAILSARSPVLKDIFISLIRNKMEKRVTIDIPNDVLEDFVVFLYTGVISIKNISMAQILYDVAKKYRINDLLEICLKYTKHEKLSFQ